MHRKAFGGRVTNDVDHGRERRGRRHRPNERKPIRGFQSRRTGMNDGYPGAGASSGRPFAPLSERTGSDRLPQEVVMSTAYTIFDDATKALNEHDYGKFESLHDQKAELWQPGVPGSDVKTHIEALKGMEDGFPDARWTPERPIGEGDRCFAEVKYEGTQTGTLRFPGGPEIQPTGKKVSLRTAVALTLSDGKIKTAHVYTDRMGLMEQLGVVPQREAVAG